jgi:LysM repeat protein
MKKLVLSFLFLVFTIHFVVAQKGELFAKSSDKGLYLEHKVVPKESFFSVGRFYHVSPKFIATFNKLEMNKGLFIDQKIRIPLTDTNFTQEGNSGTPVYYKVKDKEDLDQVSAKNKNVSVSNLKLWNNLSGNQVKEGSKLIVGFLTSQAMPSQTINNKPVLVEPVKKTEEEPVQKTEEIPVVKTEEKPVEKTEEKPVEKIEEKPVVKMEEKPVPVAQGYFKNLFDQQVKMTPAVRHETVTSGIFKTASGWQDAKYYLLMDAVQPGIIVKIINPENNKMVYAKVLGEMSGIRQNEGLNIRISNAAASALQIQEQDKFIVKINY